MKKRDKFWLRLISVIICFSIIFIGVSIYNIVQFNNSYILEEKNEIDIFRKQIEWTIKPYLIKNDIDSLKQYAEDFKNDKAYSFRIFDSNKNVIISSLNDNHSDIANNDDRVNKHKYDIWDLYITSFHDKSLEKVTEIDVNDRKYYLEISLSQEFVISSIIKAQENIFILTFISLFLLILGLIYMFSIIRKEFNTMEDSVIKISQGNMDSEIKISKIDLLSEFTLAIQKMTERLKNQISRLTQLEKYRTDFISNISHEIKTPITAINSAVELIEENDNITEADKECFEIIKSQTYSINRLVSDILALAEINLEKTNENKNFKNVNLNKIIQEAIDNQGITENTIKFSPSFEVEVYANEELIITAISNLLSNAVKYSDSKKIDVVLKKGQNVILEITDYGIGISQEHLPRIFERFYRVDKARSRKNGGTGLGLAIVKNIIELHNWQITVESELSKGTSFKIIIPNNFLTNKL